jgi:hypothetical protein
MVEGHIRQDSPRTPLLHRPSRQERKGCDGAAVEEGSKEGCTRDIIYISGRYALD